MHTASPTTAGRTAGRLFQCHLFDSHGRMCINGRVTQRSLGQRTSRWPPVIIAPTLLINVAVCAPDLPTSRARRVARDRAIWARVARREPGRVSMRRMDMGIRAAGLVSLLVLVACGSGLRAQGGVAASSTAPRESAPSSLLPTTTAPLAGGTCTAADLARVVVLPQPVAHVVTQSFGRDLGPLGDGYYLDPPLPGVTAKITADEAWTLTRGRATPSATSAELWLGMWGMRRSPDPSNTLGTQPAVLAWVLFVHHVAEKGGFPSPPPPPGMTTPSLPICFWADETTPINATTGENLGTSISSTGFR